MTDKELYITRYIEHMEKGDDPETARLRIIEEGCPIPLAKEIEQEEGDEECDE
jgi:chromosome condensin MukBEF MukE localization factor